MAVNEATDNKIKKGNPILKASIKKQLENGPLNRDQLVRNLKTPRSTVYDALRYLIIENEVRKAPHYTEKQHRGRPRVVFSLVTIS